MEMSVISFHQDWLHHECQMTYKDALISIDCNSWHEDKPLPCHQKMFLLFSCVLEIYWARICGRCWQHCLYQNMHCVVDHLWRTVWCQFSECSDGLRNSCSLKHLNISAQLQLHFDESCKEVGFIPICFGFSMFFLNFRGLLLRHHHDY